MNNLSRDGYHEFNPQPKGKYHKLDLSSEAGAKYLAGQIKRFWSARGGKVKTWLVEIPRNETGDQWGRSPHYVVRTDMVGGLPRDFVSPPD